jgi:ankyrin repeat protein
MMEKHGKTTKEMKQSLSTQIGVPQRFLSEDGSWEIPNDDAFTAQQVKVQLVCSEFWPPEFQEGQRMVSACRDHDSVALETLLKCPRNPNFTDLNGNALLHHAANGHIKPMQLLLEAGATVQPKMRQTKELKGTHHYTLLLKMAKSKLLRL